MRALNGLSLASLGSLSHVDGLLVLDDLGGEVLTTRGDGTRGSNLHGDVVGKGLELVVGSGLGVGEREGHDVAKLAVGVDVAGQSAVLNADTVEASDLHVLTNVVNHLGELGINGAAIKRASLECLDISGIVLGDGLGKLLGEASELGVGANKVGLASELQDSAGLAILGDEGSDSTLVGVTTSTLDSLGDTHLTQDVNGLLEIAIGLDESLLALHHRRVGHLAKLLNESGGNLSHVCPSFGVVDQTIQTGLCPVLLGLGGLDGRCHLSLSDPLFASRQNASGP